MRKQLELQADRIETVLALNKIPARVTGGTVTPRWVRFQVVPAVGTKISKIKGMSEEFAAALDVQSCRVSRRGAAVAVEIPRDDPQPVRLMPLYRQLTEQDGRKERAIPAVAAILGLAEDGAPLLIRLPSPNVAHVLVAGTTGSGKTVLLQTMILSLAMANRRVGGVSMILVDPKGHAFELFEGLPHLARPVIGEMQEAMEALGSLVTLMERRNKAGENSPAVVVFIDELVDLLMVGGEDAQQLLTRLIQRGRSAGIHVVGATQKPLSSWIGPLIKANFPVRVCGKVTSADDARTATGWSGTGAERLMGRGDFLAVAEGRVIRFQAAHISPTEIREEVAKLMRAEAQAKARARDAMPRALAQAGVSVPAQVMPPKLMLVPKDNGERSSLNLNGSGELLSSPDPGENDEQARLLIASALWEDRYNEGGEGYRWGFWSDVCKLLFDQPHAGSFAHKARALVARAEELSE